MAAAVYYICLPLIYLVSFLPFRLLYLLSDISYVLVYKLFRYRTKVVRKNLEKAFPEKSATEIRKIEIAFYHFFCDLIFETFKTLTITPNALRQHVRFDDTSVFEELYKQRQSVIVVMGHFGNWELAGARFSLCDFHQLFVIYHRLSNKYLDGLVYKMRTRLGNKLYLMKDAFRGMILNKDKLTATAFIADQTPSPEGAYWTTFLNQDTPVFVGTAKIARKLNCPIIYVSIKRPKRGCYQISSELLIPNPAAVTEDAISECHTRRLERDIRENPHLWLWTHRRWKHKRPNQEIK